MEIAKHMLEIAAGAYGLKEKIAFRCGHVHHAVDVNQQCRNVLCSSPDPPLHVFGDLLDLLLPDVRVEVLRVVERRNDELAPMIADYKSRAPASNNPFRYNQQLGAPDRSQAKEKIKEMGTKLLDELMKTMDGYTDLFCDQCKCHSVFFVGALLHRFGNSAA